MSNSECSLAPTWNLKRLLPTAALLTFGVILLIARFATPGLFSGVLIERMQLVLFPLLFLALLSLRIGRARIPAPVLVVAFFIGMGVTAWGYLHLSKGERDVVLFSRLQDDKDESQTRIFRERVEYFLEASAGRGHQPIVAPQRYFRTFVSDSEVRDVFKKDPLLNGVVWGSSRHIWISFRHRDPVRVSDFGDIAVSPTSRTLEIVDYVPILGIAFDPREPTAFFAARVFEGITPPLRPGVSNFEAVYRSQNAALQFATDIPIHYKTRAHRAWAAWRAGTNSLFMFLHSGGLEHGYLRCAQVELERAVRLLGPLENADLYGAVRNNLAVARALAADIESDPEKFLKTRKLLKTASGSSKMQPLGGSEVISYKSARRNIVRLSGFPPRESRAKRSKRVANSSHAVERPSSLGGDSNSASAR